MGFLSSVGSLLTDGGSETTEVVLPRYLEQPTKDIGYGVRDLLRADKGGLNDVQATALEGIINQAQGQNPFVGGASNFLSQLFSTGGLNQQVSGLANQLTGGNVVNPAMAETARVAMGGDMGKNPWLDATFNKAAQKVTDQFQQSVIPGLDTQFARSGRLGSGAYAQMRNQAEKQLGSTLGDLGTGVYGGAYATDQQNRMNALANYGGLGQQGITNQLSGAGLYQTGMQNMAGGAQLAPTIQNLRYDDLNKLFNAGQTQQQAPWAQYQSAANILGSLKGGSTVQSQQMNPLSQAIGLGTSIASTAAPFMMMSDARLKADVQRLGTLPSGLNWYRFRYRWEPEGVWRVGVMAQECLAVCPEAVVDLGGWLAVDYARIR